MKNNTLSVYIKIDGQPIAGIKTEREQFIKLFKELETLLYSDDKKHWVLYDERYPETPWHEEYYWCIPTSEINFKWNEELGWHIVAGVILDEDEEIRNNEEDYYLHLEIFNEFEQNLTNYLLYDKRANEEVFKLWYAFEQNIAVATSSDITSDNKVCLITWLEHNWGAFLGCILDKTFKYMNVSSIVLDSWNKFCE